MKRKLFLLLMLTVAVLALSSSLIDAEAEDTYNFYFQKAPGPTVVNQGVAGPTNPKDIVVNPQAAVNQGVEPPATPPATLAQAIAAEETPSTHSNFDISLGIGTSSPSEPSMDKLFSTPTRAAMVNNPHYTLGMQWNLSEHFALQAEAFYMTRLPVRTIKDKTIAATGSRLDYAGSLVITPFRLNAGKNMKLAISGLLGGMSVPYFKTGYHTYGGSDGTPLSMGHAGSFTYGGRLSLEFWNSVALQATIRRIHRYDSTHAAASVAFLL